MRSSFSSRDLVTEYLRRLPDHLYAYDGLSREGQMEWIHASKRVLAEIGCELGLGYITEPCAGGRGYMLDVLLHRRDNNDICVAAQCETGRTSEIESAFWRLLYIKAPLKLMICGPSPGRPELPWRLAECIARYPRHVTGESYLVIDLQGDGRSGDGYSYRWQPKQTGPASTEDARWELLLPLGSLRYELTRDRLAVAVG